MQVERFLQYRQGAKSKKGHNIRTFIVTKYGAYLTSSLFGSLPQYKSRREALKMEKRRLSLGTLKGRSIILRSFK